MYARALTWWTILRICMEERLVYRGDFWLGTLLRFLPIVTQVFLWGAVFAGIGTVGAAIGGSSAGGGYTLDDMIAYYLLAMLARAFSSMPGLASSIANQIRNGEIKKFLIQPVDLIGFQLLMRVAHKLVYYGVALVPFAIVFFLFRGYFPGWPPASVIVAFVISLIQAFLLGYFLEATIGMIGFWFLDVSSLLFVYMLLNFFCSGQMFPLDILPKPWDAIVLALPFQYLAFFPAAVFLQMVTGAAMWQGLAVQTAWILFFIVACRFAFRRGVKRYSAYGG
jgi:viologen exporter family transport system permease protein